MAAARMRFLTKEFARFPVWLQFGPVFLSPLEETLLDLSRYKFWICLSYVVGSPLGLFVILSSQKGRGLEE